MRTSHYNPNFLLVILIKYPVALLRCYLRFDGPLEDDSFGLQTPRSEMSWIMRKPCIIPEDDPGRTTETKSNPIFRTEDFRSTLDIGWIPDSGLDFFTLFLEDLHIKWKNLMERADSHLIKYVSNVPVFCDMVNNVGLARSARNSCWKKERIPLSSTISYLMPKGGVIFEKACNFM